MKHICVFDVNETLLDLSVLDPHFERIFGNASVRQQWFGQFIQSALVATITDAYTPFGNIGSAALDMTALRLNIKLSEDDKNDILQNIKTLPPHTEVEKSLADLKRAGFTIAALTNSTQEVVEAQLRNANLDKYFDKILSADTVKRLKPAKEPYQMVAKSFGVGTAQLRLIAAHAWDIAGAQNAGCATAFIARPGMVLDPLVEIPNIVGKDLEEVSQKIIFAKSEGTNTV